MRHAKLSAYGAFLRRLILLPLALLASTAFAQNPVPFIDQPLVPSAVAPGREHSLGRPAQGTSALPRLENYGKLPMAFEPNLGQSLSPARFLARGRGYALFLTGDEMVLLLPSRQSSVLSRQKGSRQLPVVSGQLLKAGVRSSGFGFRDKLQFPAANAEQWKMDENLSLPPDSLFTIHHSPFLSPFSIQNSESSPASSPESPAPSVVRLQLVGANARAKVVGLEELPGKSNYFIGNDPKQWRTNVPNFRRVRYQNVYPGIDVEFYGSQGQLEYDFVVHPGADPKAIRLALVGEGSALPRAAGGRPYQIDSHGDILISTDAGEVRFGKPSVYQTATDHEPRTTDDVHSELITHNSKLVTGGYVLTANNELRFEVGAYDRRRALVIDPVLVYSTYLGGSSNGQANGIAVDSAGNAYVTGYTTSTDFPTANPFQASYAGGNDVFVTKLNASGSALVYSTYLGGLYDDEAYGIAVDSAGNAYVTGYTNSSDFPTANPFQASNAGGYDIFVTKLNATGSALVYSTYLGGSSDDYGYGIALDSAGNAYVTGETQSSSFPTANPFQAAYGGGTSDGFVTVLNPAGSALIYSTYLGGGAEDIGKAIAVDPAGKAYVTGVTQSSNFPTANPFQAAYSGGLADAFVAVLTPTGSALVYSTYLGGSAEVGGNGIAVDTAGNAFVTGSTSSPNFPTANPFQAFLAGQNNAFVTVLNPTGSALVYSTYLGGSSFDLGYGIAVDSAGNAYVTGATQSTNFPTANPFQAALAGDGDVFVTVLNPTGSALIYSTYLGGSSFDQGNSIAVDSAGNAYVTGFTVSSDFLIANPFQAKYGGGNPAFDLGISFVAKISPADAPGISLSPLSLPFSGQAVGSTSSPQVVTLRNVGTEPLSITGISASGDFGETHTCGADVAAGATCTISVTFTPTATGASSGTLTVTDNGSGSPQTVALSGTGINPGATLSATSLPFASQNVGATSAPQTVTLTDTGTDPLTITSIAATGDFAQLNNCPLSPSTLAVSASCTISVTFTPTTGGTRTGAVTFTDNAANSPQTVSLTGIGVPPTVTLSTTTLTFGSYGISVTSPPQTVTVSNNGPGPVTVAKVTTSGDFAQTNNCVGTVAALANCTISVTFTPTASGTRAGFVTITDNAVASPQTVTLSGTGTPPTATASPSTLGFGNVAVGTTTTAQPVTLSNSGPGPLTISGISVSGANSADFPQTNNCPSSLAASASCTINVTFKPSLNAAESGTLTIKDNAATNPQTVSLSGTGQAPVASLSPGSLDFPGQTVGVTSAPEAVTLANSGSLPLTVSNVSVTSPFVVQSSTCPGPSSTLAAGASCTINLTFTPGFAGTTFGSLLVSDNSLGSAAQPASLTGEATVSFGNQPVGQTSTAQAVTVANGSATATVTVTGATATGDFAVASNSCGALPPGGSCAPTVTFTPTAPGARTGALAISRSTGGVLSVPLTGTGLGATATLSKSSVAFGNQFVGTTSAATAITVTNNGNQALNFTAIAAGGDFSVAASGTTCGVGTAVAVGANCAISVIFAPTTGGSRTGAITLADNAFGTPQTLALSGTGQDFSFGPPSGSPTTATVSPGSPATYTLSVGGEGGLSGTVTFTCSGAPSEATCTVSPNPVTVGSSAADVTVTVITTAPSLSAPRGPDGPGPIAGHRPALQLWLAALAMLVLLAVAAASRRRRPRASGDPWIPAFAGMTSIRHASAFLALVLLLVLAWAACGGGSATPSNPGTPAGTYPLTVTGSTGSGSATLSHTVTLTLTVQ